MKPLTGLDARHLRAAEGWLELGDPGEANQELGQIRRELRIHPDVLELRWEVYATAKKWVRCIDLANALIRAVPERSSGYLKLSRALHAMGETEDALENLLTVVNDFPDDAAMAYDLACYACVLGDIEEAIESLNKALDLGGDPIKRRALEEPDLQPLWGKG